MTTRPVRLVALCALVALAMTGCAAAEPHADPNDPAQLQVVTAWTSGPDREGLRALVDLFAQAEPGIHVFDESVAGGRSVVEKVLDTRIAADNPPDAAGVSVGSALQQRVADGELQDLTEMLDDLRVAGAFSDELLELTSVDGRVYGIPLGVQRVNVVWWNTAVLQAAGLNPRTAPATVDAWLADLEALRLSGVAYPLAVGDSTTQLQLFESVLIADLGAQGYRDLWRSTVGWQVPGVALAVDHLDRLLAYTDPTTRSQSPDEIIAKVVSGESAYTVLADTSLATFEKAGYDEGAFRAGHAPGTDGVFDLTADAFVIPAGAGHQDAAAAWLHVVASKEGQEAFAAAAGTLPARVAAGGGFDSTYQLDANWSLYLDQLVPSLASGIAASPAFTDDIADALERFTHDHAQKVFVAGLISAAGERLRQG